MRKNRLTALLLVLAMAITVALSGCGGTQPADNTTTAGGQTQQEQKLDADQTVRLIGYDYKSLDISAESDSNSFTTFCNVFEGLGRETVDESGAHKISLALAQDMKVSTDGLVYTFTLRDAKWSDGKPITAKDFEYSWKRLIDPEKAYDYGNFISMVKNVVEYQAGKAKIEDVGIKAKDDKTFEVTLAYPVPYFNQLIAFGCLSPQREDVVNSLGEAYGQSWDKIVYSGPFTISDYQKGSKIVYKKNPQYWDAANVKLETAECPIVNEQATIVQMFQAKQLDNIGASGDYLKQLRDQMDAGGFNNIQGPNSGTQYIAFNMKTPVFASAKTRQAMVACFDRQALLDTVYKRFVPAWGFICPQLACGDKEFRSVVPEPQKKLANDTKDPKALFIEGLKDMKMDPDPSKISLKFLVGMQTSVTSALAQFVQNQFQTKLGIKLELVFTPDNPTYFQERTKGNFDLCGGGWLADFNDVSNFFGIFNSKDGNNNGKYNNKQFDDLLDQGLKELDNAKRIEIYKQAEEIMCATDPAVIDTYYQDFQTFRYNYVKGLQLPLFGGLYSFRDCYIAPRQ